RRRLAQDLEDVLAATSSKVSARGASVRPAFTPPSKGGSCRLVPRDRITARWMVFSSSRMFPGHGVVHERVHHVHRHRLAAPAQPSNVVRNEAEAAGTDVLGPLATGRQLHREPGRN